MVFFSTLGLQNSYIYTNEVYKNIIWIIKLLDYKNPVLKAYFGILNGTHPFVYK